MFVLDTNTLIYFFKGMGDVAARLATESPQDVAIPAIVLYELETGLAKSASPEARRAQLARMLDVVRVLPFDEQAARASASIRAGLEAQGIPIGPVDVLIAGTALAAGGVLVTRNVREFGRIQGLKVEDWY